MLLVLSAWSVAGRPGLALCVLQKLGSMLLRSLTIADSMGRGNAVYKCSRGGCGGDEEDVAEDATWAHGLCRECSGCVGPSIQVHPSLQ